MSQPKIDKKIEQFDDLFVGDPVEIEKNLSDLLPEAESLENKSIYAQILSQIALAQAMQKKFAEAHTTLDTAEKGLPAADDLARVRVLLERGRVFHQADNIEAALPLFKQSYQLSAKHGFDFHTVNAAHMIAIVAPDVNEKIMWNNVALQLAEKTTDARARAWLGALYNNIAQNYIQAQNYEKALAAFKESQKYGEQRGDAIIVRGAQWGIARSLRSLDRLDEALVIQQKLLIEYNEIAEKKALPTELIAVGRGMVYEELAEIYSALTKKFATFAYQDLSQNEWFKRLEPTRLKRLEAMQRQ